MLEITTSGVEVFDENTSEFSIAGGINLKLEHSLVSVSKWESIWQKPFLSSAEKTTEETLSYVECMNLSPEIPPEVFRKLSQENINQISDYIEAKMTATWFTEMPDSPKTSETITSELIYFWLVTFNIPFEVQHWHLNRLLTLVKVCNVKNSKPKKVSKEDRARRMRELNAQRQKQYNTRG